MQWNYVPIEIDGLTLLVETISLPGFEPTSAPLDKVSGIFKESFARTQDIVIAMARKTAETVHAMTHDSGAPDEFAVEFAFKFGATGGVILASGSAEASLKVTITYKAPDVTATAPVPTG